MYNILLSNYLNRSIYMFNISYINVVSMFIDSIGNHNLSIYSFDFADHNGVLDLLSKFHELALEFPFGDDIFVEFRMSFTASHDRIASEGYVIVAS